MIGPDVSVAGKPKGAAGPLYLRWIFANAVGEAVGLGITALVGLVAMLYAGEETGALATLALALLVIVAGTLVEGTVVGLAFLMGLVLGPVLGFAQWLVLRRFIGRAALWMPANALAWALGMLVVFAGIEVATSGEFSPRTVLILACTLLCAGAVVGMVHGIALVWLLRAPAKPDSTPQDGNR